MTNLEDTITIKDLEFIPYVTHTDILERIKEIGLKINQDSVEKGHENKLYLDLVSPGS